MGTAGARMTTEKSRAGQGASPDHDPWVTVLAGNGAVSPAPARTPAAASATATAGRRTAARAVLRQHWLAATLLTAGLVLRVLAQLAYRPALFYIDSVKYIGSSQGNDPEGYKAPLRAILFVGNFDTVAAVQHLLGLAMAVALYVLLLRRGTSRWLAALAIAPVLLDGY